MIANKCRKNVHPDIKYSAIIDSSIDSKRQRPYATKARFHFQTILSYIQEQPPNASPMPSLREPPKLKAASKASTASSTTLSKEELLPAGSLPKWTTMERLTLLLLAVGIVASVEPRPQFWIAQDFVGFVDTSHFLLRLDLGHMRVLVRVVLSR